MSAVPHFERHRPARELTDEARERAREVGQGARDRAIEVGQEVRERARDKAREVKPRLRGWLHAGTTPLTLAAGIVLICLSPTVTTRIGSAVFVGTALLLFTVSAVYHRGNWSPRTWAFLRRFDHSNIFLLIAGSYTPFALLLLHGHDRVVGQQVAGPHRDTAQRRVVREAKHDRAVDAGRKEEVDVGGAQG